MLRHLQRLWQNKRLLAWLLYVALVVALIAVRLAPDEGTKAIALDATAIAFLTVLVAILLEVHKAVAERPKSGYFKNLSDAWPDIDKEIHATAAKGNVRVRWLGVTLKDALSRMSDLLNDPTRLGTAQKIVFEVAHVKDAQLKSLGPRGDNLSNSLAGSIGQFDEIWGQRDSWQRRQYDHMPGWHGVLINDDILFLSHIGWNGEQLLVAEEPYERYDATDPRGERMINHFKNWFESAEVVRPTRAAT